ncbi:MAG: triose-phosphate isomerase [Rickettsiales bacterium]|nr:triose-phosphate isomerase [Rickettsiales bacterium]
MQTVIGNWKMHGTLTSAASLASEISYYVGEADLQQTKVVLAPPALHLSEILEHTVGTPVSVSGQDCSPAEEGAYTGDISAPMLANIGATYVILGHSERRAGHGEADASVAEKAIAAKAAGLIPVICIGETLEQREGGEFEFVLAAQVKGSVPESFTASDFLLAYEPVWAIGTGKVADIDTIRATHELIAGQLPTSTEILYGGSVKPENAEEIMKIEHVDGVLVGGASLKSESFIAIIAAAEK